MWVWFFLLGISYYGYYICKNQSLILHTRYAKNSRNVIIGCGIIFIFFSGLRSGIGDTGAYIYNFNKYKHYNIDQIKDLLSTKEPGFKLLIRIIGIVVDNEQIFLLIFAAITIGLILRRIYLYSEDIGMSIFLFFATGIYAATLNGLRQYLVVAIFFYFTNWIIEKKTLRFIILALILSTIHSSAIVMIPIYFLVRSKPWSFKTFVYLMIALILAGNFSGFMENTSTILDSTVYSIYTDTLLNDTDQGANILRVIVMCIPALLSFLGRKNFEKDDIFYRVYSNMVLINAVVYIFAWYNWIFARIGMFTSVYVLLFYPYVINRIFTEKSKQLSKVFMVILFSFFGIYELHNTPYISYYLNINRQLIGNITRTFYQ